SGPWPRRLPVIKKRPVSAGLFAFGFRCTGLAEAWHGRESLDQLAFVSLAYPDAMRVGKHFHHGRSNIRERDVAFRQRQDRRIHDQVREPKPHDAFVSEDTLEHGLHDPEIEQGFVDIEHNQWMCSHAGSLMTI